MRSQLIRDVLVNCSKRLPILCSDFGLETSSNPLPWSAPPFGASAALQLYEVTSSSFIAPALIMLAATLTFSGGSLWGHAAIRATLRCLACLRMPKTYGIGRATSGQYQSQYHKETNGKGDHQLSTSLPLPPSLLPHPLTSWSRVRELSNSEIPR